MFQQKNEMTWTAEYKQWERLNSKRWDDRKQWKGDENEVENTETFMKNIKRITERKWNRKERKKKAVWMNSVALISGK